MMAPLPPGERGVTTAPAVRGIRGAGRSTVGRRIRDDRNKAPARHGGPAGGGIRDMNAGRVRAPELVRVHIRWMIRRDMPEVLGAERASFEFAWTEDDFLQCL